MSKKILEPTTNEGAIIGILQEKQLSVDRDNMGVERSISGYLVIRVQEQDFKIRVFVGVKKKNGDPNQMYASMKTIAQDYVSVAMSPEAPDTVSCQIELRMNDYFNKNTKRVSSGLNLQYTRMNRVQAPIDEHEAKVNVVGYIRSMDHEKDNNGEDTGRLKVMIYNITYKGSLNPIEAIVPAEEGLATAFENYYRVGDTAKFVLNITKTRIGVVEVKEEAVFGHIEGADAKVTSGRDVLEYHIFKGYPPLQGDQALDPEDIKEAEQERKIFLQGLNSSSNTQASQRPNNSSPSFESNPFGGTEDSLEDLPF